MTGQKQRLSNVPGTNTGHFVECAAQPLDVVLQLKDISTEVHELSTVTRAVERRDQRLCRGHQTLMIVAIKVIGLGWHNAAPVALQPESTRTCTCVSARRLALYHTEPGAFGQDCLGFANDAIGQTGGVADAAVIIPLLMLAKGFCVAAWFAIVTARPLPRISRQSHTRRCRPRTLIPKKQPHLNVPHLTGAGIRKL